MIEQAFRVTKGSKLYTEYFETKAEKQKMHDLARVFFEKHDMLDDGLSYRMAENLIMQLTAEQQKKYAFQLKKLVDKNGMHYFKKTSAMNKEWYETVSSKVDINIIDQLWCWHWPYIDQGQYALWHYKDELYGCLCDYNKDKLELPEYFEPIKMSAYYAMMELNED